MAFEFVKFPYPVKNCVGTIHYVNNRVDYHVQCLEHGQVVEFKGRVNNPGPESTFVGDFRTTGRLPIDNKLMTAVDAVPKLSRAIRPFRASGFIGCSGRIEKTTPNTTDRQSSFDIQFIDCDGRHEKFNYPIHHVNGFVRVRNNKFQFERITGRNTGSAQVNCNGVWNEIDGLQLNFLCNDVALDDRLRTALPQNIKDIWDSFRPTGIVDVSRVTLKLPAGSRTANVRIESDLSSENDTNTSSVSINPVWFPYALNGLSGSISIGDGKIGLRNIKAKHGRTWMTFGGAGKYSANDWAVQLQDMMVGSLRVDEDLLSALPTTLQRSVRALNFIGQLNMNGEILLAGQNAENVVVTNTTQVGNPIQQVSHEPSQTTSMGWNLRLDMEQAKMQLGLQLENIFGSVMLEGLYDGTHGRCKGGLEIESLTMNDIQVTNLRGPIWVDDLQSRAGRYANTENTEARPIVGQSMNGQVEVDGWVSHEGVQPFYIQSSLNNAQLTEVAAEVAPQFRDISGTGHAVIRLGGNVNELHSIKGNGNIRLRNAAIYQLPVMLALLKILKVKEATRTAFDTGNIDFTVAGDQFDLQRIELLGDAISLIGQGALSLNRQIDLNFYTVMGRNRLNIPILSQLYRASSQRILWINVIGTLDRPETFGEVLPELNERLQKLFQPPNVNRNQ